MFRQRRRLPCARSPFAVEDDGPGVPEENLETIFERFYTSRPKGRAFGGNSGLGLSIARQIVLAHGGRVWAENRKDNQGKTLGARFVVALRPTRRPLGTMSVIHATSIARRLERGWLAVLLFGESGSGKSDLAAARASTPDGG